MFDRYAIISGIDTLVLDAQKHALPFYEGLGFTITGAEFIDAGESVGETEEPPPEPPRPEAGRPWLQRIK